MSAAEILARVRAAGVRLKPLPDGHLWVGPRSALTDELRELIRAHKAELLAALVSGALPDPAAETRRQRVLAMLAERPEARYAAVVYNPESDPVTVTLAIRGALDGRTVTCELHVPRAKFDAFLLLDLIERHGATVH